MAARVTNNGDGTFTVDCGECERKTQYTPAPGDALAFGDALVQHRNEAHAATAADRGAASADVVAATEA